MYQMTIRVRYSEVDAEKRVDMAQIVKYFQDCSTFHSEDVGCGIEILEEKKKVWFLCAWQIEVERYPVFGEELTITTWPYDIMSVNELGKEKPIHGEQSMTNIEKRNASVRNRNKNDLYAYRNFAMIDKDGVTIARANSIWFLVNTETEKPVRITNDDVEMYGIGEPLPMEYKGRKIKIPKEMKEYDTFSILKAHIDTNAHVNNSQYIIFAEEYLPKDFAVKCMRADYKKAAKLHDEIVPKVWQGEDTYVVEFCDTAQKPYVVIEFERFK